MAELAAAMEGGGQPAGLPIDVERLLDEKAAPSQPETLRHPPNDKPVSIDGVEVASLAEFNGQALHFIGSRESFTAGTIPAFTSTTAIGDFLRTHQVTGFSTTSPLPMNQSFFEHANFGGNQKSVAAWNMFADLSDVVRDVFWHDWNDEISSLGGSQCFITIWEHTWLSGSSVTLAPGNAIGYVGDAWNDRISSIQNWGP